MFDWIMGFIKTIWMIVQLIFSFVKAMMALGNLTMANVYDAGHAVTSTFAAWATSILLMSPFNSTLLGGGGSDGVFGAAADNAGVQGGLSSALSHLGLGGLPDVCIAAGASLAMICFFYGFAESTVQLDKTNIQLIFSRILRWIIATLFVSLSYLLFAWLFGAFRSIYSITGDFSVSSGTGEASFSSIKNWFDSQLINIRPSAKDETLPLLDVASIIDAPMSEDPVGVDVASGADFTSIRNGGLGTIIVLFGFVKLFKKAVKFVVEQIPAFARLVVFFICAPFGLAMYASPETQQKANSYLRQFAGAVLTNLFKVLAISLATYLACHIAFPVGTGSVAALNTQAVASQVMRTAFESGSSLSASTADLYASELGFIVTSGGFLGYQLYFDLISKASEVAERFSHEIMT